MPVATPAERRDRKDSDKLDGDQSEQDEQIDSQSPQGHSHGSSHFDPRHNLASRPRDEPLHNIPVMDDAEQAVVLVDHRDRMKLITGEEFD